MTLPPLINSDNIGNYYMGFRSNLFAYDSRLMNGNNGTQLRDLINQMGTGLAVSDGNNAVSFRLPQSFDNSPNPTNTAEGRFRNRSIITNNVSPFANSITYVTPNGAISFDLELGGAWYFVVNSTSVSMFRCNFTGNSLTPNSYFFIQVGWIKNPLYTGSNFPLNAYYFTLGNSANMRGGGRPEVVNTNTRTPLRVPTGSTADSVANYSISCQTATTGANVTDMVLFDNNAPNRAIGVCSNLLKTSLPIPVGQIYRNTGVDPDGGNNPFWLCVGELGNERILMRVWTLNLT